jgi:hypothetical protein
MRIIRIVSEGVVSEIYDDDGETIEAATKRITKMMESDKVVTILGKNSSIVVRPSTVSAVSIFDNNEHKFRTTSDGIESIQNQEQKVETAVDEITDIED